MTTKNWCLIAWAMAVVVLSPNMTRATVLFNATANIDNQPVAGYSMALSVETGNLQTLTGTIQNTSPITFKDKPNAPGITQIGIDLDKPMPALVSWELWAHLTGASNEPLVQIGGSNYTGLNPLWSLSVDGTYQKVTLDYIAGTSSVNGALFNPAAFGSSALPGGENINYFTDASLTLVFSKEPTVTILETTYVKFQNVGNNGAQSLKLLTTGETIYPPPPEPIPEPASIVAWGLLGTVGLLVARRKRER